MVPLVDGEVVVAGDGDDSWGGDGRVGVGREVSHRRVGEELHYHTNIIRRGREHHRGLEEQVKSIRAFCLYTSKVMKIWLL